jgi:uncharacterized membrane protein affecting hemolysin expression
MLFNILLIIVVLIGALLLISEARTQHKASETLIMRNLDDKLRKDDDTETEEEDNGNV